jgi:TRAP-type C4-dicarboxylate transport system permease small subunit
MMKWIDWLEGVIASINRLLVRAAGIVTAGMMLFVCTDVILRYFGHAVLGSNDIVSLLLVIIITFALAHTYALRRHTRITFVISRLRPRMRAIIAAVTNSICIYIFILLIWQCCAFANRLKQSGEVSMTLGLPLHPLLYCMAAGFCLICIVIFMDLAKSILKVVER